MSGTGGTNNNNEFKYNPDLDRSIVVGHKMHPGTVLGKVLEDMPRRQGEKIMRACRLGANVCSAIADAAGRAALAAALAALAGAAAVIITDMARGGGTRKAKKSNRKRRATRSRSRKE